MEVKKQTIIGGGIALTVILGTIITMYSFTEKKEPVVVKEEPKKEGIDWKKTGETAGKIYRFSSGFIRGARDKND